MENSDKLLQDIDKKLLVLIGLFVEIKDSMTGNSTLEREKVRLLTDLGLNNNDIGKIMGKTSQQVAKLYYENKRKKNNVKEKRAE